MNLNQQVEKLFFETCHKATSLFENGKVSSEFAHKKYVIIINDDDKHTRTVNGNQLLPLDLHFKKTDEYSTEIEHRRYFLGSTGLLYKQINHNKNGEIRIKKITRENVELKLSVVIELMRVLES